ncbi:flagellar biosynthetic protein FliO [Microbacterium sp. 179-I 3D4 NHS]|uniref:flagellar biosynthetic protein FliO n=1 Tax=Microbacterium sp. 179-I 3D4 NHS TaxID=3142381 RepID=UPI00399F2761
MPDLLIALRAVVALAAVLGLLLFLSRRLQKSQAKGASPLAGLMPKKLASLSSLRPSRQAAGPRSRAEKITVVARSGLGGKAQLVVAEFGGIRYVLGVTEQGVSVVDTQEAPPAEEEPLRAADTPLAAASDDDDRSLKPVA